MTYPPDCVQAHVTGGVWWEKTTSKSISRGRLIWAWIPYITEVPTEIVPVARADGLTHGHVTIRAMNFHRANKSETPQIPVAALQCKPGERWIAFRAKERPAIVVHDPYEPVDRNALMPGYYKPHVAPTLMVAPSFGNDSEGRASFPPEITVHCRRGFYSQYIWDMLPLGGTSESIIRLDQIRPIGRNASNYRLTDWQLSMEALVVLDSWMEWLQTGMLDEDSDLCTIRDLLLEL